MLVGSLMQRLQGRPGFLKQGVQSLVIQGQDFHSGVFRSPDGGPVPVLVEEFNLAKIFTWTEL